MVTKPNLLIVGEFNRKDYIDLFKASQHYFNFYFLEYISPKEVKSNYYQNYGQAIFWGDFKSANDLLHITRPDKVIFLCIESYNHVALNLACKNANIPTYLLEHGLRADYILGFDPKISPPLHQTTAKKLRYYGLVFQTILARIKNRLFLLNTIKVLPPADAAFVKQFVKVRKHYNCLETFRRIKSDKRLADIYISFTPQIFKVHQAHNSLPPDQRVIHIGVPYFDHLINIKPKAIEKAILLIDQPLAEHGLLKWDQKYKETFIAQFTTICKSHHFKLYIKPHPKQDESLWLKAQQNSLCELIDDDKLTKLAPSIPVITGFYSTYLMPFAAFNYTTLLTLENHPAGRLDVSKSFTDAGVAYPVYDLEELHNLLPNIEQLHAQQLTNKAKFTKDWMYKFDGKSGERLRDILLNDA
ncbi:alpha-2,8-polysialyltransferase family protein [Pontibacter vulgaris]|uniref:alpha-2,8-polysialyltransferase family protein n=1 Tax=Pontibacter vulgaris TaxID=2905679 RepID=UPI001FA80C9A|nr:alpha-2,8-polysialyltransferase family protein [Pontibacter vulgaris]